MAAESPARPAPIPDADSAPFWAALNEGRLLVQRCLGCGRAQLYFRALCKHCWSRDLRQEDASGVGTVYSFTVVHQVAHPALRPDAPYVLALIDLDEGPRVVARIDAEGDEVEIGDRVRASLRRVRDEQVLLHFAPLDPHRKRKGPGEHST